MSRIVGSDAEVALHGLRLRYIPLVSTIAAILLALLPIVASAPLLPDFGFLMLITWRLMRPEIWTPRTALALGLLADLVAGNPLGQSMLLWTSVFLAFEMIDGRLGLSRRAVRFRRLFDGHPPARGSLIHSDEAGAAFAASLVVLPTLG